MQVTSRQAAHNRRRIEHRVLCHTARGLVEAHSSLPLFCRREGDGLYLDDRAEEARYAETKHSANSRRIRGLLFTKGIEAAHLHNLVDVLLCHRDTRRLCFT